MERCIREHPEDRTDSMDETEFSALCKALGHPARVRILRRLDKINQCVCGEIVEMLPLAQSTVSQHLKQLKEAGLIRGQVEGPCVCYCVNRDVLQRFKKMADML